MKVVDLISPAYYNGPDSIVRFCWDDASDLAPFQIVTVITRDERQHLPRDAARERWRDLRRKGWSKDEGKLPGDPDSGPREVCM